MIIKKQKMFFKTEKYVFLPTENVKAASAILALNARDSASAVVRHVAQNSIWRLESALLRLRKVPFVYENYVI